MTWVGAAVLWASGLLIGYSYGRDHGSSRGWQAGWQDCEHRWQQYMVDRGLAEWVQVGNEYEFKLK